MRRTHLGNRQRDERSVSPVVAVVLMLAITVALVGVAIPMVFAQTDRVGDPAPDANFAFAYTEDVSTGETDSFGATGDDSDADGKIDIVLESGDSVPAEQLTVLGAASAGALGDSDEFEDGDVVSSGARITVWANRGDTVQLIWTAPEEDTSSTLAEFTVRPTA